MSRIQEVKARQLIDCKCRPMVEVEIRTDEGVIGRGSAPTGSSVGIHEAFVLRDGDPQEYGGLSVHRAVRHVTEDLAPVLIGMDVHDQRAIDLAMIAADGTSDKHRLGGNAIYSTSVAVFRAAAASEGLEPYRYLCGHDISTIPVPSFNVINGGRYEDRTLAFNEFLLVPYGAGTIDRAVEMTVRVFQVLEDVLSDFEGRAPRIGRSYGWAAPSEDPRMVLSLMERAVARCGFEGKFCFALDCASSEMYDKKTDTYELMGRRISPEELIEYAGALTRDFPVLFIEDLLDEDAWEDYAAARAAISSTLHIGDDLIASTPARLQKAHELHALDGFILKPNQAGTLTEALDAHRFGQSQGLLSITSGRAGGVVGDIVMDLAVGLELPFIKNGAPRSGERIDKLNFLMRACDLSPGCQLSDLSEMIRFQGKK